MTDKSPGSVTPFDKTALEQARRRKMAVAAGLYATFLFSVEAILSRLGFLENWRWLRSEITGPLSPGWLVSRFIMVVAAGLIAGSVVYKFFRFPAPRPDHPRAP